MATPPRPRRSPDGTARGPLTADDLDVSVVIPTHDRPLLLRQALDSVLGQTRLPREVVVVDNGTTDGVADLARAYGERVRYVRTEPAGVQAARNAGVREARSTWVAFLDDDDLYRPDYLERAEPALRDGRADLVVGDHRKFTGSGASGRVAPDTNAEHAPAGYWDGLGGGPRSGEDWTYVGAFPVERLLRFTVFYPSTVLVQRALVERVGGFDPAVRGIKAEDLEFMTRLLPVARVAFAWRALVDYRVHGANNGGDLVAQAIGRWRIFEHVREQGRHGSPALEAALAADLPTRRRVVLHIAFRYGLLDVVREVAGRMTPDEHTDATRALAAAARLPRPAARAAVRLLGVVRPREHPDQAVQSSWGPGAPR